MKRASSSRRKGRTIGQLELLEGRALMAGLTSILTNEHADFEVVYEGGAWELAVHNHETEAHYEADEALLYVGQEAIQARPTSSDFDFLGIGPDSPYYRLPSTQNPNLLYLGTAAEFDVEVDTYEPTTESKGRVAGAGEWAKASLTQVVHLGADGNPGTGVFSIWQSGDGGPNVFASSFQDNLDNPNSQGLDTTDGIGPDDAIWIVNGGHSHFNFGFSQPGRYEVTFIMSVYLGNNADDETPNMEGLLQSEERTLYFSVDNVGRLEFESSSIDLSESLGLLAIDVIRTGGSDGQLAVDYATSDSTALGGSDFESNSGTLVFADGESRKTIFLSILEDSVPEPSESLELSLSNASPTNLNDYLQLIEGSANGLLGLKTNQVITILSNDHPPLAGDDSYQVDSSNVLRGNVLFNDSDEDGDSLSVTLLSDVTKGSLSLLANGQFVYQPGSLFDGTDVFTYSLSDGKDGTDIGQVMIQWPTPLSFEALLTEGHTDIGIAFEEDVFDLHVHDEENDVEFAPDVVQLIVGPASATLRAGGLENEAYDFLGVDPGQIFYRLPQIANPELLFLGIGAEEIVDGTFDDGRVRLRLKAVDGPGHFSVWQSTDSDPSLFMATNDGIDIGNHDFLEVFEGGHSHFNFGFTELGSYTITFEAWGLVAGQVVASGDVNYSFYVNAAPVASEDVFSVSKDHLLFGNVLANDIDPNGTAVQAILDQPPTHGSLTLDIDGAFRYIPGPSFDGSDQFVYRAEDGKGGVSLSVVHLELAIEPTLSAILTTEHVDIGIGFEDGQLEPHVHDETNDIEYTPDEALLYVGSASRRVRDGAFEDAAYDFLGVDVGQTFYRLPESENPELLFLGVGAEEIAEGTLDSGFLSLRLKAVDGPGHISIWQATDEGPVVKMATSDGVSESDEIAVLEGGHSHFNFAFSKPGSYAVTFDAISTVEGEEVVSELATYHFQVLNNVTDLDVQRGQFQRSFVRNVDLQFTTDDALQEIMATPSSIRITKFDLNGENGIDMASNLYSVQTTRNTLSLDFGQQGIGGNRNTNAGDGYYRVSIDVDNDGQFEAHQYFYRLLGDVNGNGEVNSIDSKSLLEFFGTNNPEYDVNGDGIVNSTDRGIAVRQHGRRLLRGLWLDD